jgi:hypothetical protein
MSDTPAVTLERSRVDVIARMEGGIPDREYLPGADGLLAKAKRIHVSAEKKAGKSMSMTVVTGIEIVAAGGVAAVLDRENGPDEYARRVACVLDARRADRALRERARACLRYYAWPALDLKWATNPGYPEALADVDVVMFDSSRQHLSPFGLVENSADDWSLWSTSLLDPLAQAGKTTITLDNTGHLEKDRARGTTAKEDLADIAFNLRVIAPFSLTTAGRLELRCTASRIGEITSGDAWQMQLGAGQYGSWQKVGARPPEARDELRDAALQVLAGGEVIGSNKIAKAIRERPGNTLRFNDKDLRAGLEVWASDPASGVVAGPDGKGFTTASQAVVNGATTAHHDTRGKQSPPRPTTATTTTAELPANNGNTPVVNPSTTGYHGSHGGRGGSRRDTTPHHRASENGHGMSVEYAEAIAAEHMDLER